MVPSIPQFRVVTTVLPCLAIVTTLFRFYIRHTRGKLWWDDAWAFLSLLCIIVLMVANLVHLKDPTTVPHDSKIAVYYMVAQFYYAVAWSARLSILFTVIRLSFERMRRVLAYMSVVFFIIWAILFAQVWWVCEAEPSWKGQPIPQCALGRNVAIAQVITDVTTDAILIFAPINLIWSVRLNKVLKIRLVAVFATTSITTAVSLYHAYAVFRVGGLTEGVAATVQASVSLLVANLPVVVAFLFKLHSSPESDFDESDNQEPLHISFVKQKRNPTSTLGLTTTTGSTPIKVDVHGERIHAQVDESRTAVGDGKEHSGVGCRHEDVHDIPDTFELKVLSGSSDSTDILHK
ncbi:hypothetical protein EW146_g5485 [Bondarzewia mesenterica]|uniref:Rhodopsin domain-containing protein n=1 Tax=Bondarzewia mesenterica TaxID=1095465 RepID=A0A4S4LRE7_9AGAM|nr:hypothetical protein EW146_g5485 [Bondarzewia mesenterica]